MSSDMMRGAQTRVDTCARVRAGEHVLIVCDHPMVEIAEGVARIARERDADVISAWIPGRVG